MKQIRLIWLATLAGAICFGCEKSNSEPSGAVPSSPSGQTVARVHWLGKKQIAAATNSAGLISTWNQPEGSRLEAQTLDKLSTAPWRLFPHVATTNTAAAQWLRPLLDDCIEQESYLEIRCATHQPGELAFAIRLSAERAALWQTNLAAVLESLTGIHADPIHGGWSLKKHKLPNLIELTRAGEWTVVGISQEKNVLLGDFVARINRNHSPLTATDVHAWLDANLDLRSVADAFKLNWSLPADLPNVSLSVIGDAENVHTRGELVFPKPLPFVLEPWRVPTNLIQGSLSSFTAARGLGPLLDPLKKWKELQIGAPPHQMYFWANQGLSMQTYFAAPLLEASNEVHKLSELVLQKGPAWFDTNGLAGFEESQSFNGLRWRGLPYMTPFLSSTATDGGDFMFGGFFPLGPTNHPPSPVLLSALLNRTNLVYYDWEITGPRVEQWVYMGQFIRFVLHRSQLPAKSAGLVWLRTVMQRRGNCVTEVRQTGPETFSFIRQSDFGFTAIELQLLVDWLESPKFPCGLSSFKEAKPRITLPESPEGPPAGSMPGH